MRLIFHAAGQNRTRPCIAISEWLQEDALVRAAAVLICCVVLRAAAPGASAAIKVESESGRTLVTFKKVRCERTNGDIVARAFKKNGWRFIFLAGRPFPGFRLRPLFYTSKPGAPILEVRRPRYSNRDGEFGSSFFPESLRNEPAGHVSWPGKGKYLKVDHHFAYSGLVYNGPPYTTLDIAGKATCSWHGKKPRG
jgi:hypothetical protein